MKKTIHRRIFVGAAALLAAAAAFIGNGDSILQAFAENADTDTLVIDAGHGGFDGGAVGGSHTVEQDINLSIAQRAQALAEFFGVHTAMTRTDRQSLDYDPARSVRENKIADIRAREKLVQDTPNPVFISIHLNKFEDPQYRGAQVFYSPNHAGSKILGEQIQTTLVAGCDPENHRKAKPAEKTIYLMKRLPCPAVIVECGFLSNPNEEKRLNEPDYHKKLAVCIVYSYLQYEKGS